MDILLVIILLVFGVLMLVAELFLLPGFGAAGIAGFLSLAAAVAIAYIKVAPVYPWAGHATLVAALVLLIAAVFIFFKSRAVEKMALDTTISSSVDLASPGKKIENLEQEAERMSETKPEAPKPESPKRKSPNRKAKKD